MSFIKLLSVTIYFLVTMGPGNSVLGQNLVFNPSFEILNQCPPENVFLSGGLEYATGWINPNKNSPDLFTSCTENDATFWVPENAYGVQSANTGEKYCGIFCCVTTSIGREYIQTQLIRQLIPGRKYCFESYFSLAEKYSNITIKKLGVFFSNESIKNLNDSINFFGKNPQLLYQGDTLNQSATWLKFEGEFIAEGGERYLIIGNFFPDSLSDTLTVHDHLQGISNRICYFYIDDVSLECCDPLGCGYTIPNSFTPNNDGFNDTWDIFGVLPGTIVQVYNRWGNKVFESNNYLGDWKGDNLPDGTYYYLVNGAHGQFYKGFLEILR